MGAILRPGLEKLWAEQYDKNSDEWEAAFSEDSLEEIEIGLEPTPDATIGFGGILEEKRVAVLDAWPDGSGEDKRIRSSFLPRLLGIRKG
jgi:hypothetical protein